MNVNPYLPPQQQPPHQGQGGGGGNYAGGPQPWEVGEVLSQAWNTFKPVWAVLVFPLLIVQVVEMIPGNVSTLLVSAGALDQGSTEFQIVNLVGQVVQFIVQAFFTGGVTQLVLKAVRNQGPSFGDIFAGGRFFLYMFASSLLTGLAVGFGFLACIVPGVILWLGLMFGPYLIVDRGLGPIEALSESWRMTKGQKGQLFIMGLATFLVALAGVCACGVGVLVAIPVIAIAWGIVYTRMAGTGGGFGGGGMQAPFPGVQYGAPYGAPPGANPYAPAPPGYGPPPPGGYGGV